MSKAKPIARAIDVGYGLVKYTTGNGKSGVSYHCFPSIAIPAGHQSELGLGARGRNTFRVPVESGLFEVGAEIHLATSGTDYGRSVRDDFLYTSVYHALVLGALNYMHDAGDRTIDVLVLGLPVNQWIDPARREYLQEKFVGSHALGHDKTIVIKEVIIQAQPMGGYIDLAVHAKDMAAQVAQQGLAPINFAALASSNVLVVDPGEHTLDWLLVQEGNPHESASGAASGAGRHRIVNAVMTAMKADLERPLGPDIHARLNMALLKGGELKLSGEVIDLSKYDSIVRAAIVDPINQMLDNLGGKQETLDLIVVVGGHPDSYRDELRRLFPKIPCVIPPNALMSNVRGFYEIGQATVDQDAVEA